MRLGIGYDVHKLAAGRPLILGGVTIPYALGLVGHSDADVLLHAIMDAMLGALALGDIGSHFPDTDPAYKGISSLQLLRQVAQLCREQGYTVANIDSVIIAQKPKLTPYISSMRAKIAQTLAVPPDRISVKATTTEGLGFCGAGAGMAAQATALLTACQGTVP